MSPSAPRGYRSGAGRSRTPVRVPDVESAPCPSRPGPHWLVNDPDGSTRCRGCDEPWAAIDAGIRARLGWVGGLAS